MKYIVCQRPQEFRLLERPAPLKAASEALIKIRRVGICGTDIHAYGGNQAFFTYPRILGHELAAEVLEVDENEKGIKPGDRVAIMPYLSCGDCIACRNGKSNCCTNIQVLGVHTDGGMQEIISVRTDLLIPANELSLEEIAIIEPLAIGAHALRRAGIRSGETVLVMGCGPIGIGIMKFAQMEGAKVIAMDVNEERLTYTKEKIGVDFVVNAMHKPLEEIKKITNQELATVVFDATGNAQALMAGPDYMAHGGRYVLVGLSKGDLTFHHPSIHAKEISLLCSRNATTEDFEYVISALERGLFPVGSYITHSTGFENMISSFDSWTQVETGVIKALVKWD